MTTPAAGVWRRYAAWSLDFGLLATLSLLLCWSRMQAASHELGTAFTGWTTQLGTWLGTALAQGGDPATLAPALLREPAVLAGADAVQSALLGLVLPPLLAYGLLALPYHVLAERGRWRGSPGKHALGLAVARADGTRPSLGQLVLRHLAGALSWLTLNLGHALALVPPHRALHDLLSGTAVFDASGEARLPAWARAWLALQVLALALASAWLMLRYAALLQAALDVPF